MKPVPVQSPPSPRLLRLIRFGPWLLPLTALIVTRESPYAYTVAKAVFFRVVVEISLPLYLILALLDRRFRPPRTMLTCAVAAYAVAMQLSTLLSLDPAQSWWGTLERMDGAFATLHFLALFLLLAAVFRLAEDWRIVFHVWLASSVVVGVIAANEHFFQHSARPGSLLGGSPYLATYALFQVFFGVCVLLTEKSRWLRRWGAFCVALNLLTLWLTATRGAMIGLGAGLLVVALLLLVYEKQRPRVRLAAAAALILLVAVPAAIRLGRGSALLTRALALDRLSVISRNDPTTQTRLILLGVSWNAFKARPIQGYGPEMFLVAYSRYLNPQELTYEPGWFDRAHDRLADVAVMDGLIGLLPYIAIFVAAAASLLGALRHGNSHRPLLMAAFGMLTAYFMQNLFLFDTPVSSILFYSLLAFIVSLSCSPDPVTAPAPAPVGKKKQTAPTKPRLPGRQRIIVGLTVVLVAVCIYANITALAQAEYAADLTGDVNEPGAFQEAFRQMMSYGAWSTSELVQSAADELAGSSAIHTPAFAGAAHDVTTEMEARAAAHRVLDPRFFISLGTLYNEQSASDPSLLPQAEAALKKAIELAPRWPDAYDALALSDLVAGRSDAALALLKQAVDINPDNGQARWYYAFVLIDHGRQEEGLRQLAAALPHYRYQNPRDLERLVHAYYKVHDLPNAVRFQEELVGLQPDSAAHHAALAQLYRESGNPADALREINIAVQLDGSYAAGAQEFVKSLGSANSAHE